MKFSAKRKKTKQKIFSFLKEHHNEKISRTQLSRMMNLSYPTICTYVRYLEEEKKVFLEDLGNIKLIHLTEE